MKRQTGIATQDAQKAKKGARNKQKKVISLRLDPSVLSRLDALANRMGTDRSALIQLAVIALVENGIAIKG